MRNTLPVLSFKIFLALLCKAQPQEKYHYFFQELADQNNLLTRKGLCILLKNLISVIEYIGEGCSFGNELIAGTVESCFQTNNGALGISEQDFICWLMQDPQLLVSLSTLHRIQISELGSLLPAIRYFSKTNFKIFTKTFLFFHYNFCSYS